MGVWKTSSYHQRAVLSCSLKSVRMSRALILWAATRDSQCKKHKNGTDNLKVEWKSKKQSWALGRVFSFPCTPRSLLKPQHKHVPYKAHSSQTLVWRWAQYSHTTSQCLCLMSLYWLQGPTDAALGCSGDGRDPGADVEHPDCMPCPRLQRWPVSATVVVWGMDFWMEVLSLYPICSVPTDLGATAPVIPTHQFWGTFQTCISNKTPEDAVLIHWPCFESQHPALFVVKRNSLPLHLLPSKNISFIYIKELHALFFLKVFLR